MIRELSKDVKIMPVTTCLTADAATDRTSEVIDTYGFNRCMIVYHAGPQAAGASTVLTLQHADAASNETTLTSGADIASCSQTVGASDDGEVFVWELQPTKRYIQVTINKDGANATNESIIAYLYDASESPVTHAAGGTGAGTGTGVVNTVIRCVPAISGTA